MKKIKIQIDTIGYTEKPKDFYIIKPRVQNSNSIQELTLNEIIDKIKNGFSISPGILINGCKSENWTEQTLFMVDIDNNCDNVPLLHPSEAIDICIKNNIYPVLYYFTFSHNDIKPKYRLVFVMDKPITDTKVRKNIISKLNNLFSQSDKQCNNADRVFLGTNKDVCICDLDATISIDNINSITLNNQTTYNSNLNTNEIPNGTRNNALFQMACRLKERMINDDDILSIIKNENINKCTPPLSDKEVETLVKSAINRINNIPNYICRTIDKLNNVKLNISSQLLAQYIRENANYFLVKNNASDHTFIYWYIDGVYKRINEDMFKGYIKRFITDYNINLYKSSIVNEVFKDLTTDLIFINQEMLNSDENIINFKNGLYDIKKKTLIPHTPTIYSTIQIPCDYINVKDMKAPVFESFINRLTDGNKETQSLLLQFIGVCISNIKGYRFKKALFMVGDGDTGKSQLKSLVEKLLGNENYTSTDLNELEDRFGTSMLYNKRLAGSSDMSFISVKELKQFKKLTGGDSVFTEFKGHPGFDQIYNGLLWFCCNKLPKFSGDNGMWVYNRIMIIKCNNVIPKAEQDKHLLEKMYNERAAIVQLAITELQKTIDNGYEFIIPKDIKKESKKYRDDNSTVINFIKDCCTERTNYNDGCTTKKLYDVYKEYCKDNNNGFCKTQKEFKDELMKIYDLSEEQIIKRTNTNIFYTPITITPSTYRNYFKVYGYNEYMHKQK